MLKRQLSLFALMLAMACAPLTAQYSADSKEFALAKAAIEGLTNYAKTANKEQLKRSKIRTRNFQTSKFETMAREAGDLFIDYGVNIALNAMGGKTLCDGGDKKNPINTHKALSILIVETAKLIATEKLTPTKLGINFFKKFVEKYGIANKVKDPIFKNEETYQNIIFYVGLAAASVNQEFYDDLEAGTVDMEELKNGLGKYRSIEGTINAYGLGYLGGKTSSYANDTYGKNHHGKIAGDLMMIPLKHLLFAVTKAGSLALQFPDQFKKTLSSKTQG